MFIDKKTLWEKEKMLFSKVILSKVVKGSYCLAKGCDITNNDFRSSMFGMYCLLTLSSIYTHFNTSKKKAVGKHGGKS